MKFNRKKIAIFLGLLAAFLAISAYITIRQSSKDQPNTSITTGAFQGSDSEGSLEPTKIEDEPKSDRVTIPEWKIAIKYPSPSDFSYKIDIYDEKNEALYISDKKLIAVDNNCSLDKQAPIVILRSSDGKFYTAAIGSYVQYSEIKRPKRIIDNRYYFTVGAQQAPCTDKPRPNLSITKILDSIELID